MKISDGPPFLKPPPSSLPNSAILGENSELLLFAKVLKT